VLVYLCVLVRVRVSVCVGCKIHRMERGTGRRDLCTTAERMHTSLPWGVLQGPGSLKTCKHKTEDIQTWDTRKGAPAASGYGP
jgi:hypothetical protein